MVARKPDDALPEGRDVTGLLRAWSAGDRTALDELTALVYEDLHRLARRHLRSERPDHSLQTTALVNEAYLRLVNYTRLEVLDRAHFFAVSAQAMRRILVDHARRRNAKRGGDRQRVSLDQASTIEDARSTDLVALDDALRALTERDPRKARVVEMRYFGGLTVDEVASVLGVSAVTVMRDWRVAKAWLYRELTASHHA
jgi:RNA polymerase sigma factor (TIGR02999 family)